MKTKLVGFVILLFASTVSGAPKTMRLDFFHTGNANQEMFSLDRVVVEPLAWPGNPRRYIDETNRGKYLFEVIDARNNRTIFSRGFASVYGEWETTAEAKQLNRSFHESLRFPEPESAVQIVVKKRDQNNIFHEVWSVNVDPKDMFIDRAKLPFSYPVLELHKSGDPASKVDFLILGDGYTAAEMGKFEKDARRLMQILFSTSPFRERKADFNIWGLCPPATESGVSRPSTGIYRRSPLGASYDAFGSERYVLTYETRILRDVAALAPYEFMEILLNARTYGGGGIFGLYGTVAADSLWSPYIFIHEFGHHFAGLADEYYTSDVAYLPGEVVEPWEPNATALLDPKNVKWKDLVDASTPIPTPWQKEAFEKYAE
ncbi:MAG TPA: M64 family metallopeptidase, partial [Acidobacteriota bacterium]|nr:M64 family metallopeptidase [Acidobacteriota bacterium]